MEPLDYATGPRRKVVKPSKPDRPYTPVYEPGPIMQCLGWILYLALEILSLL